VHVHLDSVFDTYNTFIALLITVMSYSVLLFYVYSHHLLVPLLLEILFVVLWDQKEWYVSDVFSFVSTI